MVSRDTGAPIGQPLSPDGTPHWVKVIDQSRCIGCHACTTACKSENEVPLSVTRTSVKSVDVGTFPEAVAGAGTRLSTHNWRSAAAGNERGGGTQRNAL